MLRRAAAKPSRAVRRPALSMAARSPSRTAAKSVSPRSRCRRWCPNERPKRRKAALRRETPSRRCSQERTSCCGVPTSPATGTLRVRHARRGGTLGPRGIGRGGAGARRRPDRGARIRNELFSRERAARKAKLGLWAVSYYDLLDADNPADVLAERGRFALLEGKVVSGRESGATIYVNFGRRWTEDFTATILKRNERSFATAGLEPKRLAGRRVRVRGWVEAARRALNRGDASGTDRAY